MYFYQGRNNVDSCCFGGHSQEKGSAFTSILLIIYLNSFIYAPVEHDNTI